MKSIGDIFKQRHGRSALLRGVEAALVCEALELMFIIEWGEGVKEMMKILHFKNKKITIACMHSALSTEIKLKEKKFLDMLNKKFGEGTVEQLKFML